MRGFLCANIVFQSRTQTNLANHKSQHDAKVDILLSAIGNQN